MPDIGFARWLRGRMAEHDLNMLGLAQMLDLSHTSVRAWLVGKTEPSAPNIRALARVLGVPVSEVYVALGRIPPREAIEDLPEEKRVLIEYIIGLDLDTTAAIAELVAVYAKHRQPPDTPDVADATPPESDAASVHSES